MLSPFRMTAVAALLIASSGHAIGQPGAGIDLGAGPQLDASILARYEGHRIVRVTHRSQAELDSFKAFNLRLMSEREGVGPVDYLVPPQVFDRLVELGLDLEVIAQGVGQAVASERARIDTRDQRFANASFFDDFRVLDDPAGEDVTDISDFLDSIAQNHPDLIAIETIGTSVDGRPIRGVTITADNGTPTSEKPLVFINAGIHAREWLSPSTALYIIDQLTSRYESDPRVTRILDQAAFFVIPNSNPDGYTYTHTTSRFWRKNRRDNGNGTFGVDLNRNFGFEWGGLGADTNPSSDIYRGPAPFSEPESRAIRDAALTRPNTAIFVDVHTYSQLILFPWGYDTVLPPEPVQSDFFDLSNGIRDAILSSSDVEYTPIPSHQLYPASGVLGDWGYGGLGALAWTFELRPDSGAGISGFAPLPDQIIPTGEEILEAFLYLADLTVDGVRITLATDAPSSLSTSEPTPITFRAMPVLPVDIVTDSARVMARSQSDSGFTPIAATTNAIGRYTASLPAADCNTLTDYYLEITDSRGISYTLPANAPSEVFTATSLDRVTTFADNAETDQGWTSSGTATAGLWERGAPARGNRTDPSTDADGNGFAFLTGNEAGNTDVDDGSAILNAPTLNVTEGDEISFAYWLNSFDTPNLQGSDGLYVERFDGTGWRTLRSYRNASDSWRRDTLIVGQDLPADPGGLVLRFVALDANDPSVLEAGLDDFRITRVAQCSEPCLADVNADGSVNGLDFGAWLAAFNANDTAADQNTDGTINGLDFGAWLSNFNAGCD